MRPNSNSTVVSVWQLLSSRRVAQVAVLVLSFLVLAYVGNVGRREVRRKASLEVILELRSRLQSALDALRNASGPTTSQSATDVRPFSDAVKKWATQLELRLSMFRSTYQSSSEAEALELGLSEATLDVANGRITAALDKLTRTAGQIDGDHLTDRDTDMMSIRADIYFDSSDWATALKSYRHVLARRSNELTVAERIADCLYSLQQAEEAQEAYVELAQRCHERGSQLMTQLDHVGAALLFRQAVRIRRWLYEQGRRDLAADLIQSSSSCGNAFFALRDYDQAGFFLLAAISLQIELIQAENRVDLAAGLVSNHAQCAKILWEMGKPNDALTHLDSAINIVNQLVSQGRKEFSTSLATNLAHRGLVRQAQGQSTAAAQDFERAAETFGSLQEFAEATSWQARAVELATGEKRNAAQTRLDQYRTGKSYQDPASGP